MRRSAPILRLQIISLIKMPPKSRKVQLAAARKNKALKNAINETLLNNDQIVIILMMIGMMLNLKIIWNKFHKLFSML